MNAQKIPTRQQGAALVIVLALLSGSLMIGISGMNSALIDERLAGNYRATALAQMNAERAASEASTDESFDNPTYWASKANADNSELALSAWKEMIKEKSYKELKEDYPLEIVDKSICDSGEDSYSRCLYFPVVRNGLGYYVVAIGVVEDEEGNSISESYPIFLKYEYLSEGSGSPKNNFLDSLKDSGNAITTFVDRNLNTSGNAKARDWDGLINNVVDKDGNNPIFASGEDFLEFIDILKEDESVNYFNDFPNNKKLGDYDNSIVVVENDFSWSGNQGDFTGILILLGDEFDYNGGGNSKFRGSLMHVPYSKDSDNGVDFLQPKISVKGGNGDLVFDQVAIESLKDTSDGGNESLLGLTSWELE